jgi:uncharacterized membrane protein YvbJ
VTPRYCGDCGHETTEHAAFCSHCGKPLQQPIAVAPTVVVDSEPARTVVVQKNSHPFLTFIGAAVLVLIVIGAIVSTLLSPILAYSGSACVS